MAIWHCPISVFCKYARLNEQECCLQSAKEQLDTKLVFSYDCRNWQLDYLQLRMGVLYALLGC